MFLRTIAAVLLLSTAAAAQEPRCVLGDHLGVPDNEARTATDLICHELAREGAANGDHEVRFGVLGGQTLMTVSSTSGDTYDERRTFITGMSEVPVAAPRLVSALVENKPLEETRTVDNVLSTETRVPKQQNGTMGFDGALFGTTALGTDGGSSAGLALGLLYRASGIGLSMQGRAGGIGSGERKIGLATLDVGARYYLSDADVAPFLGGGFGLSTFTLNQPHGDLDGSGFGAYSIAGVELMRSHHAAFSLSLRADLPFYKLEGSSAETGKVARYVVPLSFNVGVQFH